MSSTLTTRTLLLALWCVAGATASHAADRFVSTAGTDTANDCLASVSPCRTIAHALTQVTSGDTIKLGQGLYAENDLTISASTTLAISGGWVSNFASQDPRATKTKINARYLGQGLVLSAAGTTIDVSLDTLTIDKADFSAIVASSTGSGSLTLAVSNVILKNSIGNYSEPFSFGGAITASAADTSSLSVSLTDTTLKSNRTAYQGGGIVAEARDTSSLSLTVTGSAFKANWAENGGGGIRLFNETSSSMDVDLDECTFEFNRGSYPPTIAGGSGGGLRVHNFGLLDLSIVNSVFKANTAEGGAAIGATASAGTMTFTVLNSSFRRNRASIQTGGISAHGNGGTHTMTLRNTVIWGNKGADSPGEDLRTSQSGGSFTVEGDHCDIGDRTGSFTDLGGNINADPLLKGDLHLRAGSPAIDAGTCTGAPTIDFDGDTRPTGAGCDMGADEFVP